MKKSPNVIWQPQEGSQTAFLTADSIVEVLYHGTRGGGKTDSLLMSFGKHTGKGYGAAWRGILFRKTYPQLSDVINKTRRWFPRIWPSAKFNAAQHVWTWPDGEQLLLRHFKNVNDYDNYHGHEYPWIGWEELCSWPDDDGYRRMISCCRSSVSGMPRMIRATTNPYGPGHAWVKQRFCPDTLDRVPRQGLRDRDGIEEPTRLSIFSNIAENKILLDADPDYVNKIAASARNPAERKAWLEGSWDIVAGGMFDDVFDPDENIVSPFAVPANWRMSRSFDWGSSRPFSVGYWAVSNGEDLILPNGQWRATIRGDIFRVGEIYGWTGKANEGCRKIAADIRRDMIEYELRMGWRDYRDPNWCRLKSGVADNQIFTAENGNCIATDMRAKCRVDGIEFPGIYWRPADKRAGSRITGWDQMRRMLKNSHSFPRERPGLFVFDTCHQWLRTVPVLPRDEKEPDDADTEAEDHIADETRYFVRDIGVPLRMARTIGSY